MRVENEGGVFRRVVARSRVPSAVRSFEVDSRRGRWLFVAQMDAAETRNGVRIAFPKTKVKGTTTFARIAHVFLRLKRFAAEGGRDDEFHHGVALRAAQTHQRFVSSRF